MKRLVTSKKKFYDSNEKQNKNWQNPLLVLLATVELIKVAKMSTTTTTTTIAQQQEAAKAIVLGGGPVGSMMGKHTKSFLSKCNSTVFGQKTLPLVPWWY